MDADLAARLRAVFDDEGSRTIEAVADDAGVDLEDLVAARRALGLATEFSASLYGAAADEHARHLAIALAAGIPMETLLELDRVIARTTAAVLSAAQDSVISLAGPEEDSGADQPRHDADVAVLVTDLAPEMEWLLAYSFRQHAAELLRRETGAALILRSDQTREMTVGFADLVGYTDLGARRGPEALNAAAHQLELLASECCRPPVNVVKFLGDAVMVVCAEPVPLVSSLLDLLAAAGAHPELPHLRAGAAHGPMIGRAGDWYGSPVNLASRLTTVAPPGRLAVTDDLATRIPHAGWGDSRQERLRGFGDPVTVRVTSPS